VTRSTPPLRPAAGANAIERQAAEAMRHWPQPRYQWLPGGLVGFFGRLPRLDDCRNAALATLLQVDIEELPDPKFDERLMRFEDPDAIAADAKAQLKRWLSARDLELCAVREPIARWIGVVPGPGGYFSDHCLVMVNEFVLHDVYGDLGYPFYRFKAEDIRSGFTVRKRRR
jgi:hypothetical protein